MDVLENVEEGLYSRGFSFLAKTVWDFVNSFFKNLLLLFEQSSVSQNLYRRWRVEGSWETLADGDLSHSISSFVTGLWMSVIPSTLVPSNPGGAKVLIKTFHKGN